MAAAEQKKSYAVIKQFKGLNTKANRTAIAEEEFSWLENAMPIGFGNLKIVPTYVQLNNSSNTPYQFSNTVTVFTSANIGLIDYLVGMEANGGAEYLQIVSGTNGTVASPGTFSAAGVSAAQWKNERLMIGDPNNGLFSWDGNNTVAIGSVGVVAIVNGGSNYATPPTVTISAPDNANGVQATAVATISTNSGGIEAIIVGNAGTGYTTVPNVVIGPPQLTGGTQAVASAGISGGAIVYISVTNAGSGYISPPSISIVGGGGANATATAVVNTGQVTSVALTNAGTGYVNQPTVTFSGGGGNGAVAVAEITTFKTGTLAVQVTNGGTGYTNVSNVTVTIGNASGWTTRATGVPVLYGNTVGQVIMSNFGAGYTNTSNTVVTITDTSPAVGGVYVTLTSGGTGYTNASNLVITIGNATGWTTQATATGTIANGAVSSVTMTNYGAGYNASSNIVVAITGGGGANAKATATLTPGPGTGATANAVVSTSPIVSVATFSGRVWVAAGRTVYYSAAGSYSDFTSVSAGSFTITDSTLHGNIQTLLSANNFLYIFGDDSINVFSDVRVTTTGVTIFTNTNVSASLGTKRIYAVFPYFRSVLFMNDYGVYALVGSTTSKISDPLDGIFPLIDFTKPVSGGQVLVNNILCAAFNFTYKDPVQGARQLQAVFFEKKWFLTSQGSPSLVNSAPVAGYVNLYATDGINVYVMYKDSSSNVSSNVQTALLPMQDTIRTKQALKFGIEATQNAGGPLSVTVDSETASSPPYTLYGYSPTWYNSSGTTIPWYDLQSPTLTSWSWSNSSGVVVGWSNVSSSTIGWGNQILTIPWLGLSSYFLYKSDAQQYGKYLGLTVTSTSPNFVLSTFEFEHELRVRF